MTILVTGAAGFIGYHTVQSLLQQGEDVVGLDNINDYYSTDLKKARLAQITDPRFTFHHVDIAEREDVFRIVAATPGITAIVHLAAQAGVRYSMIDPYAYVRSNVMGHVVMLEAARQCPALKHFVFASSSSVYGLNETLPFRETDAVNRPSSLYAATKRADELISHSYAHLYGLPQTGLRFFTVYGPWGRPDMAYYSFAKAIVAGQPITLYEGANLRRDFTYIDDIVSGVVGVVGKPPGPGGLLRVLNIGNTKSEPVRLLIQLLEDSLGRKAVIKLVPRPAADIEETCAAVDEIAALTGFAPRTALSVGITRFADWFKSFEGA